MLKRFTYLVVIIINIALLAGCGEKEELTVFKEEMNQFYAEVSSIESTMEAINEEDVDAVDAMLEQLEQMSLAFEALAEVEIPAEFISVEELADDAAAYMYEAVRLYDEAYEEDYVSDSLIQAATENYESAMKRINYIAVLLQGEIPEGAVVVEGDGTEFEPYSEEE